jgi:hypothetical protein
MRKINILFIVLILLSSRSSFFAGDFKLLINYTEGEHSKDSWSKETTITIDDKVYSYTMEASGHIKPKNEDKNGTFTQDQFDKIKSFILENNLLKNDSLFDESTKYKSFERFTNTMIRIFSDTNQYVTRFNGDVINLEDKSLYKNSIGLINLILDFIKNE